MSSRGVFFGQYFIVVVLFTAVYTIWASSLRAQYAIPLAFSGLITFAAWFILKRGRALDATSNLALIVVGLLAFFLVPRSWYQNVKFSMLDYVPPYITGTVTVDPSLMSLLLLAAAIYVAWKSGLLQSLKRFVA